MKDFEYMKIFLRCPECHSHELTIKDSNMSCHLCGRLYPMSLGRPVLLRHDNDLFCLDDYLHLKISDSNNKSSWQNLLPTPSVNLSRQKILQQRRTFLEEMPLANVLVVGSGCQRKWLNEYLGTGDVVRVIYSDIDTNSDVDLFCDGHELPFIDGAFDAVVTTAVLEHVLYPEIVASEITRVLKVGGLLYSELPFMQQVHEGAYDFTRYTLSGHRRLFNQISEIESGMVAGSGTALVWVIENFALAFSERAFFRKIIKIISRIFFSWFKYFDIILKDKPAAMDGASCTFLFGRKIEGKVSDGDIIARYVGAKSITHT